MTERRHPLSFSISADSHDDMLAKVETIIRKWYGDREVVCETNAYAAASVRDTRGETPIAWTVNVEAWLDLSTAPAGPPPPPPKPARPTLG